MSREQPLRAYLPEHDLMCFADVPAVYHCHHFNVFLDQTIDDALGSTRGTEMRFEAAREVSHELLSGLVAQAGLETPAERVQLACRTFATMGHGQLDLAADADGGRTTGNYLHYGFAWREKYGAQVRRNDPADAFAAGFAAAATEVAFGIPRESMLAKEASCIASRSPRCEFELKPGPQSERRPSFRRREYQETVRPSFTGQREDEIVRIAAGLRDFMAPVVGDQRGLVQAFGVYITLHLAGYYDRISYDALHDVQKRSERSLQMLEILLRESGHVCVFNTFGGILMSPEWEAMVGSPRQPEDVVFGCAAIGRALGFGHWTVEEFVPDARLVMRTPSSYEASYHLARHGLAQRPNDYFFQGAVLAIAQLAHRVNWTSRPALTQSFYNSLFRGGVPWVSEQTSCLASGDDHSQIVVTKKPERSIKSS